MTKLNIIILGLGLSCVFFADTSQSLDSSVLSASSDDGDDEFIDLSSACGLDDDVSWSVLEYYSIISVN